MTAGPVVSRKITATENVSLDGVMETPEEWAFKYQSSDFQEAMFAGMGSTSTMLFGRVTFEKFAAVWPDSDIEPFASHMRNASKYVVSNTLETAEWGAGNEVPVLRGDLTTGIDRVRHESDADVSVLGSGALVRSLLNEDLLDELVLCVHPVVLGSGKKLFENQCTRELSLVKSRSFTGGIVILTYRPADGRSTLN